MGQDVKGAGLVDGADAVGFALKVDLEGCVDFDRHGQFATVLSRCLLGFGCNWGGGFVGHYFFSASAGCGAAGASAGFSAGFSSGLASSALPIIASTPSSVF